MVTISEEVLIDEYFQQQIEERAVSLYKLAVVGRAIENPATGIRVNYASEELRNTALAHSDKYILSDDIILTRKPTTLDESRPTPYGIRNSVGRAIREMGRQRSPQVAY